LAHALTKTAANCDTQDELRITQNLVER